MPHNFLSPQEISQLGFKSVGEHVMISSKANFYNPQEITIGNNVRIDDFVILSGKIEVGSYVHIGASSNLTGSDIGIMLDDFVSISSHVRIFAVSDDYSGGSLTNPCIPSEYKNVTKHHIHIARHCIIGSGSLILPNAYLAEGVAIGAMSMVLRKTKPWGIYFGIPARRIRERKKDLLQLEKDFLSFMRGGG